MKKLLIVESPSKIKTIKKYLGDEWTIKASLGHISDLPSKSLGIDKQNGFKPAYEVVAEKKNVVSDLLQAINQVGKENVYLGTDEDREGEAISFHLCRNLGLDYKTAKRVTFNEITEGVIKAAVQQPRMLDIPLVSAQEARRVIDRLVGYEVSPVLWKKIASNVPLSAGRVQSVAVKLIVEREREITGFSPESNIKVSAVFVTGKGSSLKANATFHFTNETEAKEYLLASRAKNFSIVDIIKEPKKVNPQAPFSTATLQEDANRKLKFPVDKTMQVAQKLYEQGHITYMRTDSINLSDTAISMLALYIKETYGENYLETRKFKNKDESAQEAHEAIRPTKFNESSIIGTDDEIALYDLIYHRAVASQMKAKEIAVTTLLINTSSGQDEFKAAASIVTFDGFTRAYSEIKDEDLPEEEEIEIKENLSKGEPLTVSSMTAKQSYSKPKNRFSEGDLVKDLKKRGIGRPATYASIIKNIKDVRKYVGVTKVSGKGYPCKVFTYNGSLKEESTTVTLGQASGKLVPNEIAFTLVDFLQAEFTNIMDYSFTATCESHFDLIAKGKEKYLTVVTTFYDELAKCLVHSEASHSDVAPRERKTIRLGEFEKKPVSSGKGEHGVYVVHKDSFYNVAEAETPEGITLERAIEIIQAKREKDKTTKEEKAANTLYTFGKFKIIQGQYGPYITNGKDNVPFPKWDLEKIAEYNEQKCKDAVKGYKKYKKKKS
jgi:DNA topoisomerase-1